MNATRDKVDVMADSIARLYVGDDAGAREILNAGYPFDPNARSPRLPKPRNLPKLPKFESPNVRESSSTRILHIAVRDGFIDRYTGNRLLYPAVMKTMNLLFPKEFPEHSNYMMSETHIAWWELFPSLDHLTPVTRGGVDTDDNIELCASTTNIAKRNYLLSELDWQLHARGDMNEWDGLLKAATALIAKRSELQNDEYIKRWHNATLKLFPTLLEANHEY